MSFTVAIVGPDGAGKTTICRELVDSLGSGAKYMYMGINLEVSNVLLPTTRLWLELKRRRGKRPDMGAASGPEADVPKRGLKGLASRVKSAARLVNLMGEEGYRQLLCRHWRQRGAVVLCDRDFYCDYYAYDVAPEPDQRGWLRRLHGWLLRHAYQRPDLLIVLEAPPEALYERKREGTVESLARRCREYRRLREQFAHSCVIDATQPLDVVVQQARDVIEAFAVFDVPLAGEAVT